ncbi:MAG: hypothetical protein ABJE95_21370 [Byssovorax sp.]
MRQSLQRAGAFLLLSTAAGLIGTSCAANESSMFVRSCLFLPVDTCKVTFDPSAAERLAGTIDPAQSDYSCPLLVGNQLVARGDSKTLKTETSRIEIHTAVVTIYDSIKSKTYTTFSVPATGFADPGTSSQPGFGGADVLLLDRVTAREHVGETLLSGVVLQGRTLGGIDVESAEWTFPITVTGPDQLCDFSPCQPATTMPEALKTTCRPGVDATTDCRQGCGCLLKDATGKATGDCAPYGCRADATGVGVCGSCRTSADCASPKKCVTKIGPTQGLCQ